MKTLHRIAATVVILAAGVAQAVTERWVDINAEPGGTGTQAKPFQQITDVTKTSWGANELVIHIAGGTYNPIGNIPNGGAAYMHFKGEGTPDNPVVIDGGGAAPCITCPAWSEFQKPLIVENIIFTNGVGAAKSQGGNTVNGGAIQWKNVRSCTGCTFIDCVSTSSGGAIGTTTGSFALTNCLFRNCSATTSGGALYSNAEGHWTMTNCVFEGCSAATGGAVYTQRKNTSGFTEETICGGTIYDCTFTNNTSSGSCSVLYGIINRCEISRFLDNRATGSGLWGMYDKMTNDKDYLQTNTFVNCVFRKNSGTNCALFYGYEETSGAKQKRLLLAGCTIEDNEATAGSCIVCGDVQHSIMTNCTVRRNFGVGLFVPKGSSNTTLLFQEPDFCHRIADSTFVDNDVGSAALVGIGISTLLMDRCRILSNDCQRVLYISAGSSLAFTNVVRNCLFDGNVAASTLLETFWGQSQAFQLCNNTFVNNRAGAANATTGIITSLGNAMEFKNYGLILANNIIYGNRRLDGSVGNQCGTRWWDYSNNDWLEADGWVDTNKHTPIPGGVRGNVVAADPKFKTEGDIRYLPGSACRNKGQEYAWMANATDLRGKPRIVGDAPDMGCYEAMPSGLLLLLR